MFMDMGHDRAGIERFTEHSALFKGGAPLSIGSELRSLIQWYWRNEGEYASAPCDKEFPCRRTSSPCDPPSSAKT